MGRKATLARLTDLIPVKSSRGDHHSALLFERATCHPDRNRVPLLSSADAYQSDWTDMWLLHIK